MEFLSTFHGRTESSASSKRSGRRWQEGAGCFCLSLPLAEPRSEEVTLLNPLNPFLLDGIYHPIITI